MACKYEDFSVIKLLFHLKTSEYWSFQKHPVPVSHPVPKLMTLYVIYNNPDHKDKAVFYVDCHDITQYIFVANLKMEMGI